jgi:hypothetical protein
MIVIYPARTFTLMQTVEDRLIRYAQPQIALGQYACTPLNDNDSQQPQQVANPNGYWVYILVQR